MVSCYLTSIRKNKIQKRVALDTRDPKSFTDKAICSRFIFYELLHALWSAWMHFDQPPRTLVILDALWSAFKRFGLPGCTWLTWMHFGQSLRFWSACMHFGQSLSILLFGQLGFILGQPIINLVSLDALWSTWLHFGHPRCTLASLYAL